jgi:hypothetical protein
MSGWKRFWIGGLGALIPMLLTLQRVDFAPIIDHARDYTVGVYVGTFIRYFLLFISGGGVAALNSDESKPLKLFQLGIAAPAILSAYVSAGPTNQPTGQKSAATDMHVELASFVLPRNGVKSVLDLHDNSVRNIGGFLGDVFTGLTGAPSQLEALGPNPDQIAAEKAEAAQRYAAEAAAKAKRAAADAAAASAHPSPEAAAVSKQSAAEAAVASVKAKEAAEEASKALMDALTKPRTM